MVGVVSYWYQHRPGFKLKGYRLWVWGFLPAPGCRSCTCAGPICSGPPRSLSCWLCSSHPPPDTHRTSPWKATEKKHKTWIKPFHNCWVQFQGSADGKPFQRRIVFTEKMHTWFVSDCEINTGSWDLNGISGQSMAQQSCSGDCNLEVSFWFWGLKQVICRKAYTKLINCCYIEIFGQIKCTFLTRKASEMRRGFSIPHGIFTASNVSWLYLDRWFMVISTLMKDKQKLKLLQRHGLYWYREILGFALFTQI